MVKPIWILLKQEMVSGIGISWSICKYAPLSRQITMPAPHHSSSYRPDALPATPKSIVNRIKIGAFWGPHVRLDEINLLFLQIICVCFARKSGSIIKVRWLK